MVLNYKKMKSKVILSMAFIMLCLCVNARTLRCSDSEKEIYYLNKELIDSLLDFRFSEEIVKINNLYKVPVADRDKIEFYVKNREFRLICQEFLYKDSLQRRVQNKLYIEYLYQDSINSVLIPAYKNNISGENVSYALYCRNVLKLDSAQYSFIMEKALDMARRIKKDYRVNIWNEEMDVLSKTLDKKQLNIFFRNKNAAKITDEYFKAWAKLKEANLTEQLDSAKDSNDAINYMFTRQMIKDLYRDRVSVQRRSLAELDKNTPKMIALLNGMEKKARMEEEKKNRTISKDFVW